MIFCLSLVFFRTAFLLFCMFHIMSIMFSLFSSLYLQTCPSTSTSRRCLWPHSGLPHPNALCIRYACIFTFTTLLHSSWSKAHNGFLGAFKAKPWFIMVSRFCSTTSALHAPRLPADDARHLQVNIPLPGPVSAPLGSSVSIPCSVSLSSMPAATSSSSSSTSTPVAPRVKWSVVSGGVGTQILVARDERVKVNEAYKDRAWLNYTSFPNDLSLWLGDLRSNDSAHYRCEVQQGLEDASDLIELKVKGNKDNKDTLHIFLQSLLPVYICCY